MKQRTPSDGFRCAQPILRLYEHGTAFGHVVIGVTEVFALCDALRSTGVTIRREPGPVKFGTTVIAFVEDPDGYKIELIQHEPVA